MLWQELKNKKFLGLDFGRQKIIGHYIADFYCDKAKVVIEIDGSSHNDKIEYDNERDEYMKALGLTVLRITDSDVKRNLNNVVAFLKSEINSIILTTPSRFARHPF